MTKSNYLIRKIGTPYTQCVHRIRPRPLTPNYDVEETVPPLPPPPVHGSDDTGRSDDEKFPESAYLNDPIQVQATSSQQSPTTERTYPTKKDEGPALSTDDPTRHQRMTRQSQTPIASHRSLTKTPPRQRLKFDSYDLFRDIPTRSALSEGGYYEFLNLQE